ASSRAVHARLTPATLTTARHTRTGRPAKTTWNVSAGTITGSSTKPAGPSNTTTASTFGLPPMDTATTANPTPSPNQHHHPRHRPCRQTNHHHSEQPGSGWGRAYNRGRRQTHVLARPRVTRPQDDTARSSSCGHAEEQ